MQDRGTKAGRLVPHSEAMGASRSSRRTCCGINARGPCVRGEAASRKPTAARHQRVVAGRFGVCRVGTRPKTLRNDPVLMSIVNRLSVEFICQTLNTHREGGFFTSRGYRQSKADGVNARSCRDAAVVEHIRDVHAENCSVYGVRKMWRVLQRQGIDIGHEHTARLMRSAYLSGKGKGASTDHNTQTQGSGLSPRLGQS